MARILLAAVAACVLAPFAAHAEGPQFSSIAPASATGDDPVSRAVGSLHLAAPLARDELIAAVLERNPGIGAARQAWQAALARIPQAESLDDPSLSYAFAPQSMVGTGSRFGHVVRLAQTIPYPGTLRLRAAVAEAEAAASEQRVAEVRLHLATMTSQLYDDLWLNDRAQAITQQHIELLDVYQEVATSRYAAGVAPQQAPIQAEVEAAHLHHRLVVVRTERRVTVARINALLHRPAASPLPAPPPRLVVVAEPPVPADALDSTAFEQRPELARERAAIEARQAAVGLEKLGLRPDFEPMTSYNSMWGNSDHRWMVGLSVRVPLWRKKIRAGIAEAEARLAEGRGTLASLSAAIGAEVESARARVDEAGHVVQLYENRVLPAARDQIVAARAAFETGTSPMLALIEADRSLRTAELSHLTARADLSRARAELARAIGVVPSATSAEAADPPPADEPGTERTP